MTVVFFAVEQYRTDSDTSYMSSYSLTDRILFGNNIADIRDFSVILECWDGNYMLGRNIIAGIISFIRRSILSLGAVGIPQAIQITW